MSRWDESDERERRIAELQAALKRERERSEAERKRADALESQVRTAFKVAWPGRLRSGNSDGTN